MDLRFFLCRSTSWRRAALLALCPAALATCSPPPPYDEGDCPMYAELGPVRTNPAGALERTLQVEISVRVCPPVEGLAEIRRKRIELKHHLLQLLSAKTTEQLEDPLRVEVLQREVRRMIDDEILKKSHAAAVFVTSFELK